MRSSTASSNFRASSGSRSARSSSEPFMSANNTVTCLRAGSRKSFEFRIFRIFSARYFGVYASGDENLVAGAVLLPASKRLPHLLQNLYEIALLVPQWKQISSIFCAAFWTELGVERRLMLT